MAVIDRAASAAVAETPSDAANAGAPRGFRPASRRRARIAVGAALAALAIGGNLFVYASLDDTTEVLQVVRNVRAGDLITDADLRVVEVDLDPSIPVVAAEEIGLVVNRYARVYIASGTLMVQQLVQASPVVTPGASVVAVEIRPTRVPSGLRERSHVMLVVVPESGERQAFVTTGRVVARGSDDGNVTGVFGLSVEVPEADAATVAAGDDVRVVVLDPGVDTATEAGG